MEKKKFLPEISIVIIVGIVLIILAAGISYFIAVNIAGSNGNGEVVEENGEEVPEMGETMVFDEVIGNIKGGGIVRFKMELEISEGDVASQIEERKSRIRDSIFDIVSSYDREELQSVEGRRDFREEIKDAVNENVQDGEVLNVYFTEFFIDSRG
ncbi:flagellar basal body-associated FliL family protein [Natranaerofaba carboxydovora]|uniref:flagellar basal body-associated FliL family protein n=1 Tax=Natranaerofaba carboxydovora TaxID=2742683 RepID=UPI001F13D8B1|nr:flagellar basal body-associated FliL family protein [Natranaerofaba carboxydovora]UMZ73369.1 Flagellar basal body-associated protein FliL [Natranaerofaba carboxydovora]